jgi:hypothetical protein
MGKKYTEKDIIFIGRLRGQGVSREDAEKRLLFANTLKKKKNIFG